MIQHSVDFPIRMLRLGSVLAVTGRRKSSLYAEIKEGRFPRPVKIGQRASAWPSHEVELINAALTAAWPTTRLKALVDEIHRSRASLPRGTRPAAELNPS